MPKEIRNKPKLAWIHTHFCYWTGGTKFIIGVLTHLASDYQITAFVEDYRYEIKRQLNELGIEVVKIAPFSSNRLLYWLFLPAILLLEITIARSRLRSMDRVISSMFPMNVAANALVRDKHIQFIFEPFAFFHDKEMIDGYPLLIRLLLKVLRYFYAPLDIRFTKMSKKLMTVNSGVVYWIRKIYGRSATPSYLIVDSNRFKPSKNTKLLKRFKGRRVVLHTTDFTPLKRTDMIIRSFVKVVERVPDAILLIISPVDYPPKRHYYEALVKDLGIKKSVRFEGFVENKNLPAYYSLAKCAVYPGTGSGASACSLFVLEVMSCQTPVVRTSDSKEEVIDGVSGFLFCPGNEEDLANGVARLLTEEDLRQKMGKEARKRIVNIYNTENVTRNFKLVFKSI